LEHGEGGKKAALHLLKKESRKGDGKKLSEKKEGREKGGFPCFGAIQRVKEEGKGPFALSR